MKAKCPGRCAWCGTAIFIGDEIELTSLTLQGVTVTIAYHEECAPKTMRKEAV